MTIIRFGSTARGAVAPSIAAVVISEIAWMGTVESANDEWIELHNDGETAVLDGWMLTDGNNLSIPLSGTIVGNTYAVLERTDDSSAPGAAFLVYAGALSNAGGTLSLYDANGSLVDRVAGGEAWEAVGGSNETKDTAQLTSAGWATGVPTPGRSNSSVVTEAENDSEVESELETSPSGESSSVTRPEVPTETTLNLIPREVSVTAVVPATTQVNQATTFRASGKGMSKGVVNSLEYRWNFGDTTAAIGREVTHRYQYPGSYIVTLLASYGDYQASYQTTVTVLPNKLSLTKLKNGDLQLHNNAKYQVDVSDTPWQDLRCRLELHASKRDDHHSSGETVSISHGSR